MLISNKKIFIVIYHFRLLINKIKMKIWSILYEKMMKRCYTSQKRRGGSRGVYGRFKAELLQMFNG